MNMCSALDKMVEYSIKSLEYKVHCILFGGKRLDEVDLKNSTTLIYNSEYPEYSKDQVAMKNAETAMSKLGFTTSAYTDAVKVYGKWSSTLGTMPYVANVLAIASQLGIQLKDTEVALNLLEFRNALLNCYLSAGFPTKLDPSNNKHWMQVMFLNKQLGDSLYSQHFGMSAIQFDILLAELMKYGEVGMKFYGMEMHIAFG